MPDLLSILLRKWKFIFGLSFSAAIIALLVALIIPKQYLATATALPANSVLYDKAGIFNHNIEALYSDMGSPDELDKVEGTASLDTIFIAASKDVNLAQHYKINSSGNSIYKAALRLKKNAKIYRSAYGELKVKVWDEDKNMAAFLANYLLQKLQQIYQNLLNTNNTFSLKALKENYALKQIQYLQLADSLNKKERDTLNGMQQINKAKLTAILEQLQQYEKSINEYQLMVTAKAPALLVVENARPPLKADKPDIASILFFVFGAAFIVSILIVVFVEARNRLM